MLYLYLSLPISVALRRSSKGLQLALLESARCRSTPRRALTHDPSAPDLQLPTQLQQTLVTLPTTALSSQPDLQTADDKIDLAPPPHSPRSEPSPSGPPSPRPPPFSSLYFPSDAELDQIRAAITGTNCEPLFATAPAPSFEEALAEDEAESKAEAEKAAVVAQDKKGEPSGKGVDDGEPPPPYTEESSPLESFTYVMASAGGPTSIITQVQQTPGAPINTLGGRHGSSGIGSRH